MLQSVTNESKKGFLHSKPPAPISRIFAPHIFGKSNQASIKAQSEKKPCGCGGKCSSCSTKTSFKPDFIGDLDEGVPQLDPDAGTSPGPADAGKAEPMDGGAKKAPTCSDVCDRAYKDSSLNGGGGGVICDGSTKCACAFDVSPLTRGQCPDFDKVVITHETRHLTDVDCDSTKGLHRPPFKDPSKATSSECTHRKESIKEMDALIPGATGACKTGMQSIRGDLDTWVKGHC